MLGKSLGNTIQKHGALQQQIPKSANVLSGGGAGIRTLDTDLNPYNRLATCRLQPLGHPTANYFTILCKLRYYPYIAFATISFPQRSLKIFLFSWHRSSISMPHNQ